MDRILLVAVIAWCVCASALRADQPWKRHVIDSSSRGADGVRLSDIDGDGLLDIATGWEQGGQIRVYLHPGIARVGQPWPAVTVGRVGDVEDAVFVDLDRDGAVDVVSCAEGRTRAVSIHWAPEDRGRQLDPDAWRTESLPAAADKMMWMFAMPLDVDGQHGMDLVAGGKNQEAAIGWFESPSNPRQLADWKWHALRRVGWLMSLVASDMDDDGDRDIVFSDRKGKASGAFWLENPGPGALQRKPWSEHPIGGLGLEAKFLEIFDLDGDGLDDVLLAVQPKELWWFRRVDRGGKSWQAHSIAAPEPTGVMKAVHGGDIDGDGKRDLVFSCEQAKPPKEGLMWLSCDGQPADGKWTAHALSGVEGVKFDLVALVDLDGDGDLDAITTEEAANLGVIWYENPFGRGKLPR
jgi:hypothetical protein